MKTHSFSFLIFLLFTLQSCTPKLAEPLKKIQEGQFAQGWQKQTSYPIKNGRTDDLHFFDPQTGFVINSNGYLVLTENGGTDWEIIHENEGTFFRCITFKNRQEGWLGTIGTDDPFLRSRDSISLYETKDGGQNWNPVKFIGSQPKGLCGLQKVNENFIVGCGRVRGPSYFIKTTDGGKNWYSYDLDHVAGSLIAAHFFDESHGFLIGGTTRDKKNCRSMVLETLDGGENWDTVYLSEQIGEYPWKFAFPTKEKGFISIQRNVRNGSFYHLQTTDGGKNWKEVEHSPNYYYVQGIGFINEKIGWMGGSNTWTYETRDGGESWQKLRNIGNGFNNFQTFGDSLVYGVGFGVFKNGSVNKKNNNTITTYFKGGKLKSISPLKNNRINGTAKTFHANGEIASRGFYKNNLKKGTWKYFDETGMLLDLIRMKNGTAKVSKKKLQSYCGNYKTESGGFRKILLEGKQLFSQRGEGDKLMIFPETETRFFYGFNTEIKIEFLKNEKGEVIGTKNSNGERSETAEKVN
jgi:photosystem II stability/assembly factor-like uncharacterized protein